jgi:hypothetical protein
VDVGVIGKKTLLRGVEEICTVVDGGLLTRCATKDFGLPGVEMAVKVDNADGSVLTEKLLVVVIPP